MHRKRYCIFECPNPACRMRFPGEQANQLLCPRCGAAMRSIVMQEENLQPPPPAIEPLAPQIHLLLDNLRSAFNVGSILRTADGVGCAHAYLCGISATPENPKVAKTGLSAEHAMPWSYHPNGVELAASLHADGKHLWALEGGSRAVSITDALPAADGAPLVLVCGNEVAGVDPDILNLCEQVIYLPMMGFKRSLNVAVATGIALYLLRYAQ